MCHRWAYIYIYIFLSSYFSFFFLSFLLVLLLLSAHVKKFIVSSMQDFSILVNLGVVVNVRVVQKGCCKKKGVCVEEDNPPLGLTMPVYIAYLGFWIIRISHGIRTSLKYVNGLILG